MINSKLSNYFNPSSRDFSKIADEAEAIFIWRNDLPKFFQDITSHTPYPYQVDFLKQMVDLKNQYAVISAGRGTGKTECLAVLALWYVYVLPLTEPGVPMQVVILAGSEKQARICYSYIMGYIQKIPFLQKALAKEPTAEEIIFTDGSSIKPLTASEKSVRGPHPDLLIIDEACQASDDLLVAAMPMIGTSKYARLILSSTPDEYFSLFVNIYAEQKNYPQFLRFNWSAEDCPLVNPDFLKAQRTLIDEGNYAVEYLGIPYSFVGKVFPLEKLKECVKHRNLTTGDKEKYAGVDWGFYPAPTALIIVEKEEFEDKKLGWKVLHSEPFLAQDMAEVLEKIELICKTYEVSRVYTDSEDIGENQRLTAKGLPVIPVKFKSQKAAMISNLRALVENLLIKIDGEKDYPVVVQMRDYRYDTKRNDDFVDALMLAVKATKPESVPAKWNLKDYIVITRKNPGMSNPNDIRFQMDERYQKPDELITPQEREVWEKIRQKRLEESKK